MGACDPFIPSKSSIVSGWDASLRCSGGRDLTTLRVYAQRNTVRSGWKSQRRNFVTFFQETTRSHNGRSSIDCGKPGFEWWLFFGSKKGVLCPEMEELGQGLRMRNKGRRRMHHMSLKCPLCAEGPKYISSYFDGASDRATVSARWVQAYGQN